MNKKVTVYSAALAVVFALIGCLGDSIPALYAVCTGLCIASLLIFIGTLIRQEFAPRQPEAVIAVVKEKGSLKRTA